MTEHAHFRITTNSRLPHTTNACQPNTTPLPGCLTLLWLLHMVGAGKEEVPRLLLVVRQLINHWAGQPARKRWCWACVRTFRGGNIGGVAWHERRQGGALQGMGDGKAARCKAWATARPQREMERHGMAWRPPPSLPPRSLPVVGGRCVMVAWPLDGDLSRCAAGRVASLHGQGSCR